MHSSFRAVIPTFGLADRFEIAWKSTGKQRNSIHITYIPWLNMAKNEYRILT